MTGSHKRKKGLICFPSAQETVHCTGITHWATEGGQGTVRAGSLQRKNTRVRT